VSPVDEVPVPESVAFCGLLLALSAMLSVAERVPAPVGEKVTPVLMLWPGLSVIGSAGLLKAKSAAFVPEIARFVTTRFPAEYPVAVFVSVTVDALLVVPRAWLPKLMLGVMLADGAVPFPVSSMECGLPLALSVNVSVAERTLVPEGVNTTFTVAVPPGAAVMGVGLALKVKSPASYPEMAIAEMTRSLVPALPITTDIGALAMFTFWFAKPKLAGVRVMAAPAEPVPDNATVCGLPLALSVIVSVAERLPEPAGVNVTMMAVMPSGEIVAGVGNAL